MHKALRDMTEDEAAAAGERMAKLDVSAAVDEIVALANSKASSALLNEEIADEDRQYLVESMVSDMLTKALSGSVVRVAMGMADNDPFVALQRMPMAFSNVVNLLRGYFSREGAQAIKGELAKAAPTEGQA